jgi:hypothetical protein
MLEILIYFKNDILQQAHACVTEMEKELAFLEQCRQITLKIFLSSIISLNLYYFSDGKTGNNFLN